VIAYRHMDSRDEHFVLDSWAKSYRESDYAGLIQNKDWFPIMLRQLGKLLTLPHVKVTIAFDPSDADRVADIYGWICVEHGFVSPLVYYVFVKSAYRRRGIARDLFRAAGIDLARPFAFICQTAVIEEMIKDRTLSKLAPHATFRPIAGRH
jgi:GNAT superfamily N-acetyltransferase